MKVSLTFIVKPKGRIHWKKTMKLKKIKTEFALFLNGKTGSKQV